MKKKQELWDEIEPEILIYDLTKKDNQIKELKKANSKIDDLAQKVKEQELKQKNTDEFIQEVMKSLYDGTGGNGI